MYHPSSLAVCSRPTHRHRGGGRRLHCRARPRGRPGRPVDIRGREEGCLRVSLALLQLDLLALAPGGPVQPFDRGHSTIATLRERGQHLKVALLQRIGRPTPRGCRRLAGCACSSIVIELLQQSSAAQMQTVYSMSMSRLPYTAPGREATTAWETSRQREPSVLDR
jgi:hypothetical protein